MPGLATAYPCDRRLTLVENHGLLIGWIGVGCCRARSLHVGDKIISDDHVIKVTKVDYRDNEGWTKFHAVDVAKFIPRVTQEELEQLGRSK